MKTGEFWIGILLVVLGLSFVAVKKARAQDEAQIRRDCTADALRYCKVAILSRDRATIINCMVENKARLAPKCSRHMW